MTTTASVTARSIEALNGSRPVGVLASASLAVAAGYAMAADTRLALAGVALAAGAVALVVAFSRPATLLVVAVGVMVLIPYANDRGAGPVFLDPATLLLWCVAIGCALRAASATGVPRLTAVDAAVLLFVACLAVPMLLGVRTPQEWGRQVFAWGGPYLAARLVVPHLRSAASMARLLVVAGLVVASLAIVERLAHVHLYSSRLIGPGELAAGPLERLGADRVVASFGHPIALAMFLSTAAVLAVGLAFDEVGSRRRAWIAAAVVLSVAQTLALSRIGWVVLAVGLVLLACARSGLPRVRVLVAAAVVLIVTAIASSGLGPTRDLLSGGGSGRAAVLSERSADYRRELLQLALRPGTLQLEGNKDRLVGPGGQRSIDSAYIGLADRWGIISLIGMGIIALAVIAGAFAARRRDLAGALTAVTIANLVALSAVAFIAQQQVYVWLLLGACSALLIGARSHADRGQAV